MFIIYFIEVRVKFYIQSANCNVHSATCNVRGSKPRSGLGIPSTVCAPALGLAYRRTRSSLDIRPSRCLGTGRHTELELLPVHLQEEAYRLCAVPWSSACVLRPESRLGTCRRSSPKTCPLLYMPV